MKRAAAIIASLAICLTGLIAPGSAQAVPVSPTAKPADYTPPALVWGPCANETLQAFGSECSDLVVPLDYANPSGTKITLAVSRLKHSSPDSAYQGVMLVNPGGPGGSGLIYSVFGEGSFVPGDGDISYDWVGFDPRGVGDSKPALTCDPSFFGYDRPNYVPYKRSIEREWLRRSKNYAKACKNSDAAPLLDHLKTTDNVADMESLRKALGQSQINYYGFSYGTELGQVYATLHPDRVRRFVFDGNVNPSQSPYVANLGQDVAFQKTINVYFGWLAKHDDVFHLGKTQKAVANGFYRERTKLDRTPAGGVIGPDELTDVILSAGYYVYDWVELGHAYADLVNKGDYAAIKDAYDGANPQTPGSDNGNAIYLATTCTDAPWPKSWPKIRLDNWSTYLRAPFETWANAWFNGPCSFWPGKSGQPVEVTGRNVTSKILLISETLDAATPFSGSLEVRRRFPNSSLIEGVGGTTHAGSLSGVECTDNAIGQYLTNGKVPARKSGNQSDLKCPPVPQPDTNAAPAAAQRKSSSSKAAVLAQLRKELAKAQVR
jgi:pimeloyl-ACP methyl ester carboxylesterase